MKEMEVISYQFLGLQLQEPISLIYNWLVACLCLVWFFKLKPVNESVKNWHYFFLTFAITGFFAGLAHSFYQYTGIYGKMPHWIGGITSGYFAGKGMLSLLRPSKERRILNVFLHLKLVLNLVLALLFVTFLFVIIDSALTYLIYCAGISFYLVRQGEKHLTIFIYAVIISFLGAFGFLFQLDLSLYFNREDFSHLFILISLILFYYGVKRLEILSQKAEKQ